MTFSTETAWQTPSDGGIKAESALVKQAARTEKCQVENLGQCIARAPYASLTGQPVGRNTSAIFSLLWESFTGGVSLRRHCSMGYATEALRTKPVYPIAGGNQIATVAESVGQKL